MKIFAVISALSLLLLAGCLTGIGVHPVDTAKGPGVETCITIASASPRAVPSAVATVTPAERGKGVE